MGRLGIFPPDDVAYIVGIARNASYEKVRAQRDWMIDNPYESIYLKARRYAREQAGYGS